MLGLMGDVTEMDGRSIFWDSKELEPDRTQSCYLVADVGLRNVERRNKRGRKEEREVERGGEAQRDEMKNVHLVTYGFDKTHLIPVVHVCCLVSLEYPWKHTKKKNVCV